jgi:hypothetical protein
MQGRYSLRDLRSVFVAEDLRNHLGGEYVAAERRWRFHTAASRADARALLERQPDVGVLHVPGMQHEAKTVRELGGRFIRVRNHEGAYLDTHDLAVFQNQDGADACLTELYSRFAATRTRRDGTQNVARTRSFRATDRRRTRQRHSAPVRERRKMERADRGLPKVSSAPTRQATPGRARWRVTRPKV